MTLANLIDICQEMTWTGLNQASDQVLGYISTWTEHPMSDAAYEIIKRRHPPPAKKEQPESAPHPRSKRRAVTDMLQRPKHHKTWQERHKNNPLPEPPFVLK